MLFRSRMMQQKHRLLQAKLQLTKSTIALQSWWRGVRARLHLKRKKAAIVIQHLFRLIVLRRENADRAALSLLRQFIRSTHEHASIIQRQWRGYFSRKVTARLRIRVLTCVAVIKRAVRAWLKRISHRLTAIQSGLIRRVCASNTIRKFYFQFIASPKLMYIWKAEQMVAACCIQRITRGYLAKLQVLRIIAARENVWNFLNPRDVQAIKALLFPNLVSLQEPIDDLNQATDQPSISVKHEHILLPYLPRRFQESAEVQSLVFIQCLRRYAAKCIQFLSNC